MAPDGAELWRTLQAIRERAEAATEGPWESDEHDEIWTQDEMGSIYVACVELGDDTHADAEFIAHAREDVPWLCDQLDQAIGLLRAEVDDPMVPIGWADDVRAFLASLDEGTVGDSIHS